MGTQPRSASAIWPRPCGRFFSDRRLFGFALFLVLISLGGAHAAEPNRILLLYTEEVTTASIASLESGVVEGINETLGGNVELYREQFDAHQSPDRQQEAIDWIRHRYSDRKIGVIICIGLIESGGMPINVLDAPTVYVGLWPNPSVQQRLDAKSEILWFALDDTKTLELAHHLQPKARRAIFLSGAAPRDKALEALVKNELDSWWKGPLDLEYVSGLSFQQMKELVAHAFPPKDFSCDSGFPEYHGEPRSVIVLSRSPGFDNCQASLDVFKCVRLH
jgi:hypothetical protein